MCTINASDSSAVADPIFRNSAAAEQADEPSSAWLTDSKIVDFNGTGIKCYYNNRFAFSVLVGVTTFMQKTGYKVIRLDFT